MFFQKGGVLVLICEIMLECSVVYPSKFNIILLSIFAWALGIHGQVLMDTLNQHWIYTQSTSQLILNQHLDWHLVNSRPRLDQQSFDSWLSVDQLICITQHSMVCQQTLIESWTTVSWDVNQELTNYPLRCWLRAVIDTRPWDATSSHDPNNPAQDHLITQHWLLGLTPPKPNIAWYAESAMA